MDNITNFELNLSKRLEDKKFRSLFFQSRARHEIARQIRELRQLRKMRQVDFSKASHMPQSAVSRIEQADYSGWTFKTLCKVADTLEAAIRIEFVPIENAIKEYEETDTISTAHHASNINIASLQRVFTVDAPIDYNVSPLTAGLLGLGHIRDQAIVEGNKVSGYLAAKGDPRSTPIVRQR